MAADPIAQKTRGQGNGRFIAFNSGECHLSKPATEFYIAHFVAQLGADTGPCFCPGSNPMRGNVIALLSDAPQKRISLALELFSPVTLRSCNHFFISRETLSH
jgi:hypothetical protein